MKYILFIYLLWWCNCNDCSWLSTRGELYDWTKLSTAKSHQVNDDDEGSKYLYVLYIHSRGNVQHDIRIQLL